MHVNSIRADTRAIQRVVSQSKHQVAEGDSNRPSRIPSRRWPARWANQGDHGRGRGLPGRD
eukprot:2858172-Pyramimonas_sp.AAC.1